MHFRSGLVGGHCISVDSYYMIHKAESLGDFLTVIADRRDVTDYISQFIANKVVKLMLKKFSISGSRILIVGFAYKANTSDFRNTKVIEVYTKLKLFVFQAYP